MLQNLQALQGYSVILEPIHENHREELFKVAQDPCIWTFSLSNGLGENFTKWFSKAMDSKNITFIVLQNHKIIGTTRLYDINSKHKNLKLGYTWYIPSVWGSQVNPECKYLLLRYAFETLGMNRVEFMIDRLNKRSQAAVKKLGASYEGTLRKHLIRDDGYFRDSAIYSIINTEWPAIKTQLLSRIKSPNEQSLN